MSVFIAVCVLATCQDGDAAKLRVLLSKRAEVLFSIDAKDPQTGYTAVMSASQRGHHKVTTASVFPLPPRLCKCPGVSVCPSVTVCERDYSENCG